ncbi:uncharacterized protein LOC122512027 isoform X2 [Leptopilina heterotoma]|uniref:uncharacterized protein LOC122508851 isoform X2 n=1 Tax=Leptopilina heterotoma TaxID=63436 RepID=UPI001CA81D9A|nr:uncharacterized protein LOC122508851 isoform X2 [Leptopilina heterotoma]XP_043483568.1 uncharacterized protein LOC122512027 isoform X2 [Leptopilina heterotoma]
MSYNNEISNAPCIENEPCEMESNVSDKFVLDFDSDNNYNFDSDSEITCNEDTRKTDSDLGEDDLELSDFLYRDETPVKENTFSAKLREWALKFHITLIALSALLLLLRVFDSSLPVDARTLLGTLRKTECAEMSDGVYHHFGLERAVENILIERRNKGVQDQKVKLMINVDGVPISNSGKNTFWLILCSEVNSEIVYPVGAFYGTKKPIDANEFLNSFVQEAINVCEKGVKNHNVTIEAIICDAPAKSFILYLKGHTGYDCCPKCLITGVCHRPPPSTRGKKKKGKVCFPGIGPFALKTDQDFKRNKYNSFETDVEIVLTKLPGFGCISCIPLDYMHLVLLGVTKKLISLWVLRKSKVKISSDALNTISNRLLLLRNTIPVEFNRRPRTLWEYKFWKATEFRTFLLYAGVIVLQNVEGFSSELYSHFLLLHTAISILSSDRHICDPRNIDVAHEMLQLFVTDFDSLYGKEFISYNVHNLLHLCADVKRFGALGNFSAFKFENYMGTVKRMIRKGDKPLQQLARRYAEVENIQKLKNYATEEFILDHAHNRGPLTQDCLTNIPKQYKNLKTKGFSINCDDIRNNCVMLKDGTFLIVENILQLGGQDIKIVGHRLCFKGSLYEDPDSRLINIYMANNVNEEEKHCLLLSDVISKAWKIPTSKGIAVIPLLHKAERK